jgi:hypothetical protein
MSKLGTILQVGRTFGVRDGMLRLGYELQRGSGLMLCRMRSLDGWHSWDLKRIADARAEDLLVARLAGKSPFFFDDLSALARQIKDVVGYDGEMKVFLEAENILNGNLPFFGQLSLACDFPPDWFRNPVTGQQVSPQRPWTQMRFASASYGDLKFILEPSRFLFVYPMVRAYALSGNEQFPQAFWNAVEDWARSSPPMAGPLWICGQESALRILAWSFALHGFMRSPATTKERVALLVSMIAASAWRTTQTVGYARSQHSNHLVSEAVGLWTAGTLYPELKDASSWQALGARLLHESVLDQITPEGVSLQHSFNYQRMVLQLLLWTLRLAEIHGVHLDDVVHARTVAACEFMNAWTDPVSGYAPKYGADDGTLLFPLTLCEYGDFRPLLQLGAAVLNRPGLKPGPWDEAALWLSGKCPAREETKPARLPSAETGYHRLGDENSWAMVRACQYRRRPFHADQLHVDLWWRGINLARDAGTYLYNGDPPWDNGLAQTKVHNTVTVDRCDQMHRAGRFLWIDWAQALGRSYASLHSAHPDCFEGEHDGYKRLGVKHRRMVQWLAGTGWVIVDDLMGAGEHELHLHWLVANLPFQVSYSPFQVVLKSEHTRFSWNIFASSPGSGAIIQSGKSSASEIDVADAEILGWESPTYGELQPAVSLIYRTQGRLPVRFVTVVLGGDGCRVEAESNEVIVWSGEAQVHRVSLLAGGTSGARQPIEVSARDHAPETRATIS